MCGCEICHFYWISGPKGVANVMSKVPQGLNQDVLCLQLLCLVGESFDEASEDVCGAVVNVRHKGDKIAIWTSNCQNREAILTIG